MKQVYGLKRPIFIRSRFSTKFFCLWQPAYLFDHTGPYYWGYEYLDPIFNITFSVVVLSIVLGHIVYHLNRSNYFQARILEDQRRQIQLLTDYDPLTGLHTRRKFEVRARNEFSRCLRYETNLSVIMVDLIGGDEKHC